MLKGSTTTISASGTFSVSFSGESTVALYSYTIYSLTDQNSVQNQTVNVIVDGLKVSAYSVDVANEAVQVKLVYAYDDSAVANGNVSLVGLYALTNSSGWATFNMKFTSDFSYAPTAYGVQDGAYGITFKHTNKTIPIAKATRLVESDAPIFSISYASDVLTVTFNASVGNYTLKVSGSKPVFILNATYDDDGYVGCVEVAVSAGRPNGVSPVRRRSCCFKLLLA